MSEVPGQDDALAAAKKALRRRVRRRRSERSAHSAWSEQANRTDDAARTRLLTDWLEISEPSVVAAYVSSDAEPDTAAVVEWLTARGIQVLLPASNDGTWSVPAWAFHAGPGHFRTGPRGIREPTTDRLPAEAIGRADVVLCPGLAGTATGDRLGRGGGWYDRVLPLVRSGTAVVLLLNDDEVVDTLPTGPSDCPVDVIVTPTRQLNCQSAG